LNSAAVLLLPGDKHFRRDLRVGGAYFTGAAVGALLTATTLWIAGGLFSVLPTWSRAGAIAAVALMAWLVKEGPLQGVLELPENRRQIPAQVLGGDVVRGAMYFGFEMGTGARTYVPSPSPYLLAATVLLGNLPAAQMLLIAVGFGMGRALPLMLQLSAGDRNRFTDEFLRGSSEFGPTISSVLVLGGALFLV
jgi:hypothetical protein